MEKARCGKAARLILFTGCEDLRQQRHHQNDDAGDDEDTQHTGAHDRKGGQQIGGIDILEEFQDQITQIYDPFVHNTPPFTDPADP
jgi:hypothetical protein